jgi:excisionase family DNA binding protein
MDNAYITVKEIADRLHIPRQAIIDYFIKKNKVAWEKVGNRYLIDRESFEQWYNFFINKSYKNR